MRFMSVRSRGPLVKTVSRGWLWIRATNAERIGLLQPSPFYFDWTTMSSPLELFRRNLKPMMVFLTLVALFSFVVLPSVAMYQQNRMAYNAGPASLATYAGGSYEPAQIQFFTRNHFATLQVLQALAESTISRGGAPNVPEFNINPQTKQIMSLGINSNVDDRSSVQVIRFAKEARDLGLELDDIAIRQWLSFYTDGRLSDSEINGIIASTTRNQLGVSQFYEQLRTQLLAQAYQRHWLAGLSAGNFAITPPAKQWELFLRLNRRAVVDAYAVNVSEFIDKTNAKPSDKLIRETFEEGKNQFPQPDSAKPAFRRPMTLNVEYLAGNLNEFIQREAKNFTEEQLKAEYQRRLDGGDFKLPDELKTETPAGEAPATETPASEQPAAAATDAAPAANDAAQPAEQTSTESAEKADMPAETPAAPTETPAAPAETPAAPAAPAETPADAPAADSKPATGDSSRREGSGAVRLVSALQAADEAPADAPATDSPAADTPAPAAETPAAAAPAETAPAAAAPTEDTKPADAPAGDAPAPAADAKPADAPAATAPAADDKPAETKPAVEPFEKVREQIANSLAEPAAMQKLDAAITEVDKVMRTYFNARAIAGKDESKVPARPDLKALAEKLGMKHVVTGSLEASQLQEDPISFSRGLGTQMLERGDPYLQIAFSSRSQLFSSIRTVDDQARVSYVSWKIDEQKDYVPTLEQAREDVIAYLRTVEARELARAEALKLAKQFSSSDKPAKELVPEERKALFFESVGPFSWMTSFGFGMRAFMGSVPELDRVGEAFMRQVFTSERNVWGVAPNDPETVFYVVRPTEFSPSTDELHQRFTQPAQRFQTNSLAVEEAIKIQQGEVELLDKRTGFKFNDEALREQE